MRTVIETVVLGGKSKSSLLNGLTNYWKLNETSGNRLNSVSGGLIMSPNGGTSYGVGVLGNCVTFDGVDGFLNSSLISPSLAGFTCFGWLNNTDNTINFKLIQGSTYNSTQYWALDYYVGSPNRFKFFIMDSVTGNSTAVLNMSTTNGAWYFVAGRYNPTSKKSELWVNDTNYIASSALSNSPSQLGDRTWIGRGGNLMSIGGVDSVGTVQRYLTDNELLTLWNNGVGKEYPF